jgi:hypothetical protein
MFKKKDYADYFKQLYDVEIIMKKDVENLLKIVDNPEAKLFLERIRKDEMRHARLVKSLIKSL